jgi:hypothetical protein
LVGVPVRVERHRRTARYKLLSKLVTMPTNSPSDELEDIFLNGDPPRIE